MVVSSELSIIFKIFLAESAKFAMMYIIKIKETWRSLSTLREVLYESQFGITYGRLKKLFGTAEPQPIKTPLEFKNSEKFNFMDITFMM